MAKATVETEDLVLDDEFFDDEGEDAAVQPVDPRKLEPVTVRVLKKGHGKVHTGHHHPETGRSGRYPKGAVFQLPRGNAEELEERGFVEIQDEAAAE